MKYTKLVFKRILALVCAMCTILTLPSVTEQRSIKNPIYDSHTQNSVYSYVYFGKYPQSEITDNDLTDDIINANYNKYGVAISDNKQIFRIAENEMDSETEYSYFLVEPIKWKVLNVDSNYMLLQTDKIIDAKSYIYEDDDTKNWKNSDLRSWLNGYDYYENQSAKDFTNAFENFASVAFSEEEYDTCRLIDNNDDDISSSDYVVIPSISTVVNDDYGFYDSVENNSFTRKKGITDYVNNYYNDSDNSKFYSWHLIDGNVNPDGWVFRRTSSALFGVAPMVKILVNSDQYYTTEPELVMGTDINTASVTLKYNEISYSGEERKPKATVKIDNKKLIEDVDYTIAYSDNINAGTAKVTITGCGNYYGSIEKSFTINPINQTISRVDTAYKKTYGDSAFRLNAVTSGDGAITYSSSDESVVIAAKNTGKITIVGPGTATITVNAAQTTNYNQATEVVNITVLPKKVTGLKTKTSTTSSVTLTWNKVSKASGYEVYRYSSTQEEYIKVKTITSGNSLTYKGSSLSSGKSYKYKVRAYTKSGNEKIYGSFSSSITATTKPATPKLKASSSYKGKASLSWSNVSGETGYQVYYSTKKSSGYKKASTYKSNVKKATIKGLISKKSYYFKVRAYKKVGGKTVYSSFSSPARIKIK